MNKKNILDNIKKGLIQDISINLDEALDNELVFYRIGNLENDFTLFKNRLEISKSDFVIVNKDLVIESSRFCSKNVLFVSDFDHFKKKCTDYLYDVKCDVRYIGVTGTNGKTSTTTFLSQILKTNSSLDILLIGTNGVFFNDVFLDTSLNTTPDYSILKKCIFNLVEEKSLKFLIVILEVSSHALVQNRLLGITFDCCAVTSLSQDHLDYHGNIENYLTAKSLILDFTDILFLHSDIKYKNYFINKDKSKIQELIFNQSEFKLFSLPLFMKYNLNLAKRLAETILKRKSIKILKDDIFPPKGRFERLDCGSYPIFIDYAHTPDAFSTIFNDLKSFFPTQKIVSIFGCGGNRDQDKRTKMGKIAFSFSDFVVLTNDNPRFEDEKDIIDDILSFNQIFDNYKIILNRKDAICFALNKIKSDIKKLENNKYVLIILGKGHEDYQIIGNDKLKFSDKETVESYFKVLD